MTVSELNEYARILLASDPVLRNITVRGEISGYKHHYSGHRYFSLKDDTAIIKCAMFRQNAIGLDFEPQDGMSVTVQGSVSIYAAQGAYQLYVSDMQKDGLGNLYLRFEQLKSKLQAEGLFDPARKRPIPVFPKRIGLVTSKTGAAVRDMIRVARRRNPNIEILVSPCAVQGAGAGKDIARAIERINQKTDIDVLLVGRGGGAIEDLWAFNEEVVARAIAASRIPVISCVGHEVDFTIADFVADARASTPSAGAELAVPDVREHKEKLAELRLRLRDALMHGQTLRYEHLQHIGTSALFLQPEKYLLAPKADKLRNLSAVLKANMQMKQMQSEKRLSEASALLRGLNPESVTQRGYAIIRNEKGKIISDIHQMHTNDKLCVSVANGNARVQVLTTEVTGYGKEKADV